VLAESRRAIEGGEREALRLVDTELENCRIAWRWAVANDAAEALKKSTLSLFHFCDHRDRHEDCMSLLAEASASRAAEGDAGLKALLLAAIAHLEYRLDRYADAIATATRALTVARPAREANTQTLALQVLGACSLRLGKLDDALAHFDKALQQALAGSEPRKVAVMLANQAIVHKSMGRYDEALRLSFEALEQYRRAGDVAGEALTLNNLGVLYVVRKEYESAGAQYKAGLALCDRHGLTTTRVMILANLTELAQKTNDRDAPAYAARALEHAVGAGNRALAGVLKIQFARFALEKGDLDAARRHLAESMEIALTIGRPSLQIEGLCFFAEVLAEQGELDCARRVLAFAADDSSVSVPDREEIRARLERFPAASPAAPGLSLELREMLQRIVVEAGIAYAPLIAALRAR
jgi:tetratricopeptide (TPR) repeat protein